MSIYSDGGTFCFVCRHATRGGVIAPGDEPSPRNMELLAVSYPSQGLPKRKLEPETLRKYSYGISESRGVHVAQYRDASGTIVAQKLRTADKEFPWIGEAKKSRLFGSHLQGKGRMLVITEGEIDAMSVAQAQGLKWPAVSVCNGASGAMNDLMKNLDYLEAFHEIVLCFDNDEPGQKAAKECAEALLPMCVKICTLPLKDANEMIKANREGELIAALFAAPEFKPEGILDAKDLKAEVLVEPAACTVAYPYAGLNRITRGLRQGELVTVCAGTGVGKSALVREIEYSLQQAGERVGAIPLEESAKRHMDGLIGLHMNKPLHISREGITAQQISEAFDDMFDNKPSIYIFDHFGSTEVSKLMSRIRYMVKAKGCQWIILDHLSIVVSGIDTGDERKAIDMAMTALRTLVSDTGCGMILISHLKRIEGKAHELGGEVKLSDLRGSQAIAQLSDIVIGLERNQQGDDEERMQTRVRVLKNRFTGETGFAGILVYDRDTGRLQDKPEFAGEF